MDKVHCLAESELLEHVNIFGFPLECAKEEWARQLKEGFTNSETLLKVRADQVHRLRQHPEVIEEVYTSLESLKESESILLEHKTSDTSKTAEEQIFFTGNDTKTFNHIPFLLTFMVLFKIWLAPALALLTPLILCIMPYVILRTMMNMNIPWNVYVVMMQQMVLGVQNGQPWGFKQYSQLLWTSISVGQGMIIPFFTAYHTYKLDNAIVRRGEAIQNLYRVGQEVYNRLESIGANKTINLKLVEPPSDPREAVAWMTSEPLALKITFKVLGQLSVLTTLARDQAWQAVDWKSTMDSLDLEDCSDIAIPSKSAIKSSLSLNKHSLLTGPNRGGKSSSLRSILQQVLLGQTCGMTYDASGSWYPFSNVFTRLKSKDHAGKESLFEMEVRMASRMLDVTTRTGAPTLLLIDELFHSTNPPDAETSAKVFLDSLWKLPNAKSIISTHIFSLCEAPGNSKIQKFCCRAEELSTGAIDYFYRLESGICRVSSVREVLRESGLMRLNGM
jgi:hypothetical protein